MMKKAMLALLLGLSALVAQAQKGEPPADYSQAEKLLLMSNQLAGIKTGTALSYKFNRSGTASTPFDDTVTLRMQTQPNGKCCAASTDFLTGERKLTLPAIEMPEGNPVTLYFLEHDIREMNKQTKGSARYFQKRIRMALFEAASVQPITLVYRGKSVPAQEIILQPYKDDPNRARFEQWVGKQYRFVLSDAVPGKVALISTHVNSAEPGKALFAEQLKLDGVEDPRQPAPSTQAVKAGV